MVLVDILEEKNIYENPKPEVRSRQAFFPGLAVLPDNEIICLFKIGEAFEAANVRCHVTCSKDNGKTWKLQGQLYDQEAMGWSYQFSDCYKPTLLKDGTLLAIGYGFTIKDPEIGVSGTEVFNSAKNVISFSADKGKTWTNPATIDLRTKHALELSGPAIQLSSGRLLAAGPPFTIEKSGQQGWIIASEDNGKTWKHISSYFETPLGTVAPWETRICEMQPGRVVAIIWAFDTAKEKHLPNHIAVSHDYGDTWSEPIDTGIMAQASNLMWLEKDKLLTIHAHRAGEVGLYARLVDFSDDQWDIEAEQCLWTKAISQDTGKSITDQFSALKFGQPSLTRLADGEILATFWCVEDCMYKVKSLRLKLNL